VTQVLGAQHRASGVGEKDQVCLCPDQRPAPSLEPYDQLLSKTISTGTDTEIEDMTVTADPR
jgi:hypothetical protein